MRAANISCDVSICFPRESGSPEEVSCGSLTSRFPVSQTRRLAKRRHLLLPVDGDLTWQYISQETGHRNLLFVFAVCILCSGNLVCKKGTLETLRDVSTFPVEWTTPWQSCEIGEGCQETVVLIVNGEKGS